jgi:predicted HAD superfamily Cof-like phosphohydrolase
MFLEIPSMHHIVNIEKYNCSPNEMLKGCIGLSRIMNPIVASLLEFNEAFEIPKLDKPDLGPEEMIELRIKLLKEEVEEYAEAARAGDLVEVLDALADIGYILAGTIINHGMQNIYDDAFSEVHRSNMAKLVNGKVIRREDGKVLKPEGWQPPQLAQFLS